jgi:hypothetical protein
MGLTGAPTVHNCHYRPLASRLRQTANFKPNFGKCRDKLLALENWDKLCSTVNVNDGLVTLLCKNCTAYV